MNETSQARADAPETGTSGARPAWADLTLVQAEWVRLALLSIEAGRTALDFQRTLLDLSREMLRRQQDASIEAMRDALRSGAGSPWPGPGEAGALDVVRLGMQAFERMAAVMRELASGSAGTDAARSEPVQRSAVSRRSI